MESCFKCFVFVFITVFLTANAEQGQFPCGYKYFKDAEGWFKIHLDGTTWSRASHICDLEGAVLASPTTDSMKDAMVSLMYADRANDNVYHQDNSRIVYTALHPTDNIRTNIEPNDVTDFGLQAQRVGSMSMLQALGLMDSGSLVRVSQYDSLPYICYKKAPEVLQLNECGTTDIGYALDNRTHHCYKFHRSRSNWFEAAAICATEGGHLAIINSEIESQVIQDIFADNPADFISGWAWKDSAFLGFRADEERKWITVQGQSLASAGYEGWAPGEPNNARGDESCGSVGRNGQLYDDPCTRELPYICEKRSTNRCEKPKAPIVNVIILSPKVKADTLKDLIEDRARQYNKQQTQV